MQQWQAPPPPPPDPENPPLIPAVVQLDFAVMFDSTMFNEDLLPSGLGVTMEVTDTNNQTYSHSYAAPLRNRTFSWGNWWASWPRTDPPTPALSASDFAVRADDLGYLYHSVVFARDWDKWECLNNLGGHNIGYVMAHGDASGDAFQDGHSIQEAEMITFDEVLAMILNSIWANNPDRFVPASYPPYNPGDDYWTEAKPPFNFVYLDCCHLGSGWQPAAWGQPWSNTYVYPNCENQAVIAWDFLVHAYNARGRVQVLMERAAAQDTVWEIRQAIRDSEELVPEMYRLDTVPVIFGDVATRISGVYTGSTQKAPQRWRNL